MKKQDKIKEFKKYAEEYLREQDFYSILDNKDFLVTLNSLLSKNDFFNSCLKESKYDKRLILQEAQGLLRVIKRQSNNDFQMITQFRKSKNVDGNFVDVSKQENISRNEELVRILRERFKSEFDVNISETGFYKIVGYFPEEYENNKGEIEKVYNYENSQLWVKPDKMSFEDFKYLMVDVGCRIFDQDSVFVYNSNKKMQGLYKYHEPFEVSLTENDFDRSIDNTYTIPKDKEEFKQNIKNTFEMSGGFSINKMGEFYSRMRGKNRNIPFVFEGFRYPVGPQMDKYSFKRSGILFQ